MTATCPHCGQRMLVRHGVQLSPRLADLFDLLERSGRRGVRLDVLAWTLFGGRPSRDAYNCAKVAVSQLNDHLAGTDFEVRRDRRNRWTPYRVLKRRA